MKRKIYLTVMLLFTLSVLSPGGGAVPDVRSDCQDLTDQMQEIADKSIDDFLQELALKESSNTWDTINVIGAMGLYQFMEGTLHKLGYRITLAQFREDPGCFPPEMQNQAVIRLMEQNEIILQGILDTTANKFAILAAAHLAGPGGVKSYFKEGHVSKDTLGTSITDYLKYFGYYE